MKVLRDLMTSDVISCSSQDSLADIEQLMKENQIRHMPVVDGKRIVGLLSQKEFLAEAFRITDKFGAHNLREYLAKTPVSQCMNRDIQFYPADMPLADAGTELLNKRLGCLLISNDQQELLGIVSSKDFVRLATVLLG